MTFIKTYGELAGLVIGFLGAILGGISISPFSKKFGDGGYTSDEKGNDYEFVYLKKPSLAKFAVLLIVIGFILQLLGLILNI